MGTKYKNIIFVVSPNTGLIDNWLPILRILSNSQNIKLKTIFFNSKITLSLKKNTLSKILEEISSDYFYTFNNKNYFKTNKYNSIIQNIQKYQNFIFLFKLFNKFNKILKINALKYFEFIIVKYINKDLLLSSSEMESDLKNTDLVFFDIGEKEVFFNSFSYFKKINCKFVSINNGIAVHQLSSKKIIKCNEDFIFKKILHFIFNKNEKKYFQNTFELQSNQIIQIPIPRHNKMWIEYLSNLEKKDFPNNFNEYIILASKPGTNIAFPKKNKINCLKIIKKIIIDELKIKLVIKPHPKEINDGVYDKILGKKNYNKSWVLSNNHIFNIAKNSMFCISFGGSIPVDLIRLNIPSIEFRDMNGIDQFDNEFSLRDENNNPISFLGSIKLVESASSEKEFKNKIDFFLKKKKEIVSNKKDIYYKNFMKSEFSNNEIVKLILDF